MIVCYSGDGQKNWQWSGLLALRQWSKDDHPVLFVLTYSSKFYGGLPLERRYGNGNHDPLVFNSRHYLLHDLISLIRSIVPYIVLRCFCFEWSSVGKWEAW